MSYTKRSRHLTGLVAAVIAVSASSGVVWAVESGTWRSESTETRPNDPSADTSQTTSFPQSPDAEAALQATLAGLDREVFKDIHIGDSPSEDDWQGHWLYATLEGQTNADGGALPSAWEADLAQGDVAERIAQGASNLADVVVGSTLQFETAEGTLIPLTGGAGDIRSSQSFSAWSDESDAAITASVTETLSRFGLQTAEVRVLRPLQPALYVVATVDDPAQIDGRFGEIWNALLGDPYCCEGLYLEIDTADGVPIVRQGAAFRTGSGRLWIAPEYDELVGGVHGGLAPSIRERAH